MEKAKSFTDLHVWQKTHEFVLKIYKATENFPKSEAYGLTSQLRRAAVSIAANISEGFVKNAVADKLRFYNIAEGSIHECKYYLILSKDLEYLNDKNLSNLLEEVSKLLRSYSQIIKNSS
jgi:four helix bundle protein